MNILRIVSPNVESRLRWVSICLVLGALLLFWFFVISCLVYFPPRTVSITLGDLGLCGDFFGGIIGTIISIASLGVTIYLAVILHKIERENNVSAIDAQRRIAIMQMKYQELAKFRSDCDIALDIISTPGMNNAELRRSSNSISNAAGRLTTLFPELNDKKHNYRFRNMVNSIPIYQYSNLYPS